jgi:hypothetical protein
VAEGVTSRADIGDAADLRIRLDIIAELALPALPPISMAFV